MEICNYTPTLGSGVPFVSVELRQRLYLGSWPISVLDFSNYRWAVAHQLCSDSFNIQLSLHVSTIY